jgi:hypothetical protein
MASKLINGMVQLDEAHVRMTSKNDRIEKHGETDVLACDLEFRWETANDQLALFSPTLLSSIYMADPDMDRKKGGALPGVEKTLTKLKNPEIKTYKWDGHEIVGGKFLIHGVVSGKDMTFGEANVGKWRIDPREGGTVNILFRVQINPEHKQRGHLMDLLEQGTCTISVIPPEPVKETTTVE